MAQDTYTLGDAPKIVINTCSGDLRIMGGGAGAEATAEAVTVLRGALHNTAQFGDQLAVDWCDDLRLSVPHGASIVVQRVDGDARIERLGAVQLGGVSGDLDLVSIERACTIGRVGGDARVAAAANLALGPVGGDARLEGLTGTLDLARVDGDALVRGAVDGFGPTVVGGDLTLDIQYTPGHEYSLDVAGDARVTLPADADLTVRATVAGDVSGLATHDGDAAGGSWGEGAATLTLRVGGDLMVRGPNTRKPSGASAPVPAPATGEPTHASTPTPAPARTDGDTLSVLEAVARGDISAAEADDLLSRT